MPPKRKPIPPKLLGFDIGGTKCAVLLGEIASGGKGVRILERRSFPTETRLGPKHAQGLLFETGERLLADHGLARGGLGGIGISCGGPLDSRRGLILSPPNLPGWDRVPIVALAAKRFRAPVRLENDANACAVAEWKYGAGRGCRNLVFFTFGTGLGAGLILDGRLYSGTNDLAGEAGHLRLADRGPVGFGKAGSFEGFCSGGGIAQLAATRRKEWRKAGRKAGLLDALPPSALTAKAVAEAAGKGDPLSRSILEESGTMLGKGLSLVIDLLNPERIVIGSIYARCERFLRPPAMAVIRREAIPRAREVCRLVPAALGEQIGDYAALSLAALAAEGPR
ncbi:MAG: ROK family protein [Spirochaetes bacterium]|nr:ROK family protein [Spirochaetota bacterium]